MRGGRGPQAQAAHVTGARVRAALPYVVALAAAAFFCSTALSAIDRPGLYYDESAFVNAALGAHHPDQHFVHARFHGVVTKIFPYIGGLKSWLFAPVFTAFGVSIETIRVPAVLLALLAVALAFLLARRLFGPWPAALLAVLLATDPTYAVMAKADWGPIVVGSVLRVMALLAYFALVRTRSVRWAWVLAAALLLGVFNKIDFVWFIAALATAALLVHGRELLRLVRARPLAAALPAAAFAGVMALMSVKSILPARELPLVTPNDTFAQRLDRRWSLFHGTFDGSTVYQFMTGATLPHPTPAPGVYVAAAALGALAIVLALALRGRFPREETRPAAFFLIAIAVMAVALVGTRQVGGPHHMIQLWPLPQLLAVSLVALGLRLRPRRLGPLAAGAAAAGLVWLSVLQVDAAREYVHAFEHGDRYSVAWSPEIYDMARVAQALGPGVDEIVAADWGIGPPVFALDGEAVRDRFRDLPPAFAGGAQATAGQIAADHFRGRRVLVMFHHDDTEIFQGSSLAVRNVIHALGPGARVRDVSPGPVLRAYVVDDRAPPPG
ncbi:MAG: hypothetical protein QOE06_2645 [Thermoleophilaceae bacterium]|nr:hypothetical protein [Thermoleophilaceae bacterium]